MAKGLSPVKAVKTKKKGKAKKGKGPKDKPVKKNVGQGRQETRWEIGYNANTDTLIHKWYHYTKSENIRKNPKGNQSNGVSTY